MMMIQNLLANAPKYFLEGAAVALVAHYLPSRKIAMQELLMLALTAALTFWLLDTFAPSVGQGARLGAGFGIGAGQVGWEPFCGANHENFEGKKKGWENNAPKGKAHGWHKKN